MQVANTKASPSPLRPGQNPAVYTCLLSMQLDVQASGTRYTFSVGILGYTR